MAISYRPACAQDLQRAGALIVQSINDLTERHGFGLMTDIRANAERRTLVTRRSESYGVRLKAAPR